MKYKLKKILRFFGLDIIGYSPTLSYTAQVVKTLEVNSIDLVFDIGANSGQFAIELLEGGFKGKVVSFEPQFVMHSNCVKNSLKYKNWEVHPQCAIGENEGTVELNISENSVSSSILMISDTHVNTAPKSKYISSETVKVITLDNVFNDYFENGFKCAIKIDTQGFEWQVLKGAINSLPKVSCIIIEMSLFKLYEGQKLWDEIYEYLKTLGFYMWAVHPELTERSSGRTLQMDCILVK
jgi:FkbM family methyltransferase